MTSQQQHLWHDVTYDIMIWYLILERLVSYAPPIKQLVILLKIWYGKILSITLYLTCVILPHCVNM
jgi:hypothetical protein